MNVVDSSGWLEYFTDGPNAVHFAEPLGKVTELLVPSITLYEVFKVVCRQSGEDAALLGCGDDAAEQGNRTVLINRPSGCKIEPGCKTAHDRQHYTGHGANVCCVSLDAG